MLFSTDSSVNAQDKEMVAETDSKQEELIQPLFFKLNVNFTYIIKGHFCNSSELAITLFKQGFTYSRCSATIWMNE